MRQTTRWTEPRRSGATPWRGRIARSLMGGAALAALYVAGHGLVPQDKEGHRAPTPAVGPPVPYRQVATLLAHAAAHTPALRLPHAHWFIRVRHGHEQVVVVDQATFQGHGGTLMVPRRGHP